VEQVAEVESGSAIVRFRAAAPAPEVAAHSPEVVPAAAQLVPAVPGALPAWAAAAEGFAAAVLEAVEGGDSLEDILTEKTRSDL
jgi:hypothetical protein